MTKEEFEQITGKDFMEGFITACLNGSRDSFLAKYEDQGYKFRMPITVRQYQDRELPPDFLKGKSNEEAIDLLMAMPAAYTESQGMEITYREEIDNITTIIYTRQIAVSLD